jgi:calcineurin-like phosphoesterase family protein
MKEKSRFENELALLAESRRDAIEYNEKNIASLSDGFDRQEVSLAMRPVRARILWPALGFPSVIDPTDTSTASSGSGNDATRCICLLVLCDRNDLTKEIVARYLRCIELNAIGRRHVDDDGTRFSAQDLTVRSNLKIWRDKKTKKPLGELIYFGEDERGSNGILVNLSSEVLEFYRSGGRGEGQVGKTLEKLSFLYEIRVNKAASGRLKNGRYHLFWSNERKGEDVPSDEMKYLLENFARPKRIEANENWFRENAAYLMKEYEYEYTATHSLPPSLKRSGHPRRTEIIHPLFVERRPSPGLKIGHMTDIHVDVRANVYEMNLSSNKTASSHYNNWNRNFVECYNKAKCGSNIILLTGDLIDYGRGYYGLEDRKGLGNNGLYLEDRNWFLFYYLLTAENAYTVPVYTTLGNHDWRLNPYPPFAIAGSPEMGSLFSEAKGFTSNEQKNALKQAHDYGHDRYLSYDPQIETEEINQALDAYEKGKTLDLVTGLLKVPAELVGKLAKGGSDGSLNVTGYPTETTVKSVEWYLITINPFLDYWFKLPTGHSILMLDWSRDEKILFDKAHHGKNFYALAYSDQGPTATNCLSPTQKEMVDRFTKDSSVAKVIGMHAPPIGTWSDWYDDELSEGWREAGKGGRGNVKIVVKDKAGNSSRGHPFFAVTPPERIFQDGANKGMDANYGSFEKEKEWFVTRVAEPSYNVRLVLAGHNHRFGLLAAYKADNSFGPLAGTWLLKLLSVQKDAIGGIKPPAVALTRNRFRTWSAGLMQGPLYVNTTSGGPRGHIYWTRGKSVYVYPGYTHIELMNDGLIKAIWNQYVVMP